MKQFTDSPLIAEYGYPEASNPFTVVPDSEQPIYIPLNPSPKPSVVIEPTVKQIDIALLPETGTIIEGSKAKVSHTTTNNGAFTKHYNMVNPTNQPNDWLNKIIDGATNKINAAAANIQLPTVNTSNEVSASPTLLMAVGAVVLVLLLKK